MQKEQARPLPATTATADARVSASPSMSNQDAVAGMTDLDGADATPSLDALGDPGTDADYQKFHDALDPRVRGLLEASLGGADPAAVSDADWLKLEALSGKDRLWLVGYADWWARRPDEAAAQATDALEASKDAQDPFRIADAPPNLAQWELAAPALEGTLVMLERFPLVEITSGRRDRHREAGAWAPNIAANQRWIPETLRSARLPVLVEVQRWIDDNWTAGEQVAGSVSKIRAKLEEAFDGVDDATMEVISPHIRGMAVDIQKKGVTKSDLETLPGASQALDEGNHFHIGYKAPPLDAGSEE